MQERGLAVDHSNIYRWVQKFSTIGSGFFEKTRKIQWVGFSTRRRPTSRLKANGTILYREGDKGGQTIDFCSRFGAINRATHRFFKKSNDQLGLSDKIIIDTKGFNLAALETLVDDSGTDIGIRQNKYLIKRIDQGHPAFKRIVGLSSRKTSILI